MEITFDLAQYPTLHAASLSEAFIRTIRGPAGSAKTTWALIELARRATMQAPAMDGTRYTKWLIGRTTYQQLMTATLASARKTLGGLVEFRESIPPRGRAAFTLEDGTRVDTEFLFMSLEGDAAMQKMLGEEFTGAFLDEISEFPEAVVHAVARRAGRYPSNTLGKPTWTGIIGVTNGPLEGHWLDLWEKGANRAELRMLEAEMERQTGVKRPFFHAFAQPPGLLRPSTVDGVWLPNPKAENVANLPNGYGYYYMMLADPDDAKRRAFIEGDFAPLQRGRLVFPEFGRGTHVVKADELVLPHAVPLGLSFDFGRTPVCTVYVETASGRLIMVEEVMMEDASVERLVKEGLSPLLRRKYPMSRIEWATGDPTGADRGAAVETSPFEVLADMGIPIQPARSNKLRPRLDAVKQRLSRIDRNGAPMLQIRDNCTFSIEAMARTYVFETVSSVHGTYAEKPTKSHVKWVSDLADTIQYAAMEAADALLPTRFSRHDSLPELKRQWA